MPKMPLSPKKMLTAFGEEREMAEAPARVKLFGYDQDVLNSIREALVTGASDGAGSMVDMTVLKKGAGKLPRIDPESTALVIMAASKQELSSNGMEGTLAEIGDAGLPAVLVLTEAPGVELAFPAAGIGPNRVVGIAPDGKPPADVLAEAVVDASGDASPSLAARLPVLREEACRQIIRKTARQNSIIGALFIIPGADMPVMTMNEARMLLKIAAAHGDTVGTDRAVELLGVVGGGFGLRALARQALNLLPGPGWAIKSGIAYSGTRMMGKAAMTYFEGGTRVTPSRIAELAQKLKNLRG